MVKGINYLILIKEIIISQPHDKEKQNLSSLTSLARKMLPCMIYNMLETNKYLTCQELKLYS